MPNVVNADAGGRAQPGTDSVARALDPVVLDLAFLETQTFGDRELQREVLALFVEQARRVVPSLPDLTPNAQHDAAHLLKGSARGIGAWAAAAIAETYEQSDPAARAALHGDVAATFAAAESAIAGFAGDASSASS